MSSFMPEDAFLSWGWRIPFPVSIALACVGLYIRFTIGESPIFEKIHSSHTEAKSPLREVLRAHPKEVLLTIGARFADAGNYYIFTVFILAYAVDYAGMLRRDILLCVMAAGLADVISHPIVGSPVRPRRPPSGLHLRCPFHGGHGVPLFPRCQYRLASAPGMRAGDRAQGGSRCRVYGPLAAYYAELFPARIRYSGMSIGYQVASVVLGGLTPLVASSLMLWSGGVVWPVVALIVGTCLDATCTLAVSRETYRRSLTDGDPPPSQEHWSGSLGVGLR
jgi:hypothetical protein